MKLRRRKMEISMYEFGCRIRFSEIDKSGRLSMHGLLRLFQDCGYNHAVDRGLGLEFTRKTNCTWYLLSWNIVKFEMPYVGQEVIIKTCIYDMQASIAKKSIAMYGTDGRMLAYGDTMWAYMDVSKMQPSIPDAGLWLQTDFGSKIELKRELVQASDEKYEEYLEKIKSKRLRVIGQLKEIVTYPVTDYLLDVNEHANNVRLTELAMQAINVDYGCSHLRAEFKSQVKQNTDIHVWVSDKAENGSKNRLVVFKSDSNEVMAVFELG